MASAHRSLRATRPGTPSIASDAPLAGAHLLYLAPARWGDAALRAAPLLRRLASIMPTHFCEPPTIGDGPRLDIRFEEQGRMTVITPVTNETDVSHAILRWLLKDYLFAIGAPPIVTWCASPEMTSCFEGVEALCAVYDRIGRGAVEAGERRILAAADLVFVDDSPAADEIRTRRPGVHAFSPGVALERFARARGSTGSTAYESIRKPRVGYCGVIDRRLDLALLDRLAEAKPRWSFPLVGPLSGLAEGDLPRRSNIRYLGAPPRDELPAHVAAFTIAIAPVVSTGTDDCALPINIGECLAAGKPVVAARNAQTAQFYGEMPGVFLTENDRWLDACGCALALSRRKSWLKDVDHRLAAASWDRLVSTMLHQIAAAALAKRRRAAPDVVAEKRARRRPRAGRGLARPQIPANGHVIAT